MAQKFAEKFYNSTAWRKCRESYIAERVLINGGMCEMCGAELGYILHHKIWLTADNISDPDIALNHDNLMFVCHTCHNKIDQEGGNKNDERYTFDETGQLVPLPP